MAIEVNLEPYKVLLLTRVMSALGGEEYAYHPITRIKMRNYRLKVVDNALELIGDTPMIKLSFTDEDAIIYAKVEYLNPSGSVKDNSETPHRGGGE